jgi:hypothetical protein
MFRTNALLAAGLLVSTAAFAQTTPTTNSPSTTRSTNTVGLGGTVSGSTAGNGTTAAPARYDDPNSGMPSQAQVKTKGMKPKKDKSSKMKSTM